MRNGPCQNEEAHNKRVHWNSCSAPLHTKPMTRSVKTDMIKIVALIMIGFTVSCAARQKADCLITLNKSEFVSGENIMIAISTTFDNELFENLLMGNGTIQIFTGSKLIYEMKMSPISAPKREKDKMSFYHAVQIDGHSFKAAPGAYAISIKSNGWSSGEVGFNIVIPGTRSKYEMLFKEYKAIVEPFVLQKNTKKIEVLSDEFVKKYSQLQIAEIYIWDTEVETTTRLLLKKTYIKSSGTNVIVYPKIHYTNPRAINISELGQDKQKYIMIKQELGVTEYRMVIMINE